jgi:cystathionine beta-lyase
MSTFEPSIDRLWERGSVRWQRRSAPDAIPLTVAELDVRTPPFLVGAILAHLAGNGIGYFDLAVLDERHADLAHRMFGFTDFAWSRTCSDGLQACRTALDALVLAGGTVAVETPLFPDLMSLAQFPHRRLLTMPAPRGSGSPVDWAALASTLEVSDAALLCHPHNPLATARSVADIDRFLDHAAQARCAVVIDEVHLPLSGCPSFLSRADGHEAEVVVCTSLSKTFGLSGMRTGFMYANAAAAERIGGLADPVLPTPDTFGVAASLACLDHGADWLTETRTELDANRAALESFLPELEIGAVLAPGVPGFIGWISDDGSDRLSGLLRRARIDLLPAHHYGQVAEPGWRMSYGVHRDIMDIVFDRLRQARRTL